MKKFNQFAEDVEKVKELGNAINNNEGVQKIKKSLESGKIDINQIKNFAKSNDAKSLRNTAINTLFDVGQSFLNKARDKVNK